METVLRAQLHPEQGCPPTVCVAPSNPTPTGDLADSENVPLGEFTGSGFWKTRRRSLPFPAQDSVPVHPPTLAINKER